MTLCHKKCFDFCIGTVTIITTDLQVIIGQIEFERVRDDGSAKVSATPDPATRGKFEEEEEAEFITVELTSPLLKIPGGGGTAIVQPFFVVGDDVRVNVEQIVTIGPSHL